MAKTLAQLRREAEATQKVALAAKKKLKTAERAATKKERIQARKNATRKKIIFGAFMQNKLEKKDPKIEKYYAEFLKGLTKKSDRVLFELEPVQTTEKSNNDDST